MAEAQPKMLTIKLSRTSETIDLPIATPGTMPESLNKKIDRITVAELKRVCKSWSISISPKSKKSDIAKAIRDHFNEHNDDNKNNSQWGQFNTVNHEYILQEMTLQFQPAKIIDPCFGNGDLIRHALNLCYARPKIEIYDIDPSKEKFDDVISINRDTLETPVDYSDSLLMMNPPYLSNVQNKSSETKKIYQTYGTDDLFKCYIHTMINSPPREFMIIVPLNFLCSIRQKDRHLRQKFFEVFEIIAINIFNEQVFEDTSYTVCSIHGILLSADMSATVIIPSKIFPSGELLDIELSMETDFLIGGEIYKLDVADVKIGRAVGQSAENVTNLYLKAIDNGVDENSPQISLHIREHDREGMNFGKISDRSYAWITMDNDPSRETQIAICDTFNSRMAEWRSKYKSLFLTNFRENGRKRISFLLAFRIIGNIILGMRSTKQKNMNALRSSG